MKVITLIAILALIFVLAYGFCGKLELFTPNAYIISWQKPTDNGGDQNCCNYEWQVCSDADCKTIVDSGKAGGTANIITAQTTKLDWNTKYNIQVRASNRFGPGDWVSASLSTGDGVLSSIRFAVAFDKDGNIITPISEGSRNISIWTAMNQGVVSPNDLNASALVTVKRGANMVLQQRLNLLGTYDQTDKWDVFTGDFASQNLAPFTFQTGDILSATIMVWDQKGNVITEGLGDMTVTIGAPGNVTGITLSYEGGQ